MICILGDIHFASNKDYIIATCEAFLDWFNNWNKNNPDNYLILAGDLVNDVFNGGIVIDFLERFIKSSRFKEIHVCVGNHDLKKYQNRDQLAYEFYSNKPNVHVYKTVSIVQIGPLKTLILPYYWGVNDLGEPMNEYYSKITENPFIKDQSFDLTVGHFCGEDNSFPGASDCVKNLNKINTTRLCLGHIHTRNINPDVYIGSIYASKKNENDYNRAAWIYDEGNWYEERLPIFNEFLNVTYPQPLPMSRAIIPIYTIFNCGNEKLAKEKYGDIFIRFTFRGEFEGIVTQQNDVEFESIKNMDVKELFNDFIKIQEPPFNEEIISKCRGALKI